MDRTVCIIQGHPHAGDTHLCHALAKTYAEGARLTGARVRSIDLGQMEVPLLRNPADFAIAPSQEIALAQEAIAESHHVVVIFPLWLGAPPALVKAFFEQAFRNNFAIENDGKGGWPKQKLKGKSARVVVTMGMPALAYRFMFGAHGVKGLEKSILGMGGIKPVRETLIGGVGALTPDRLRNLIARMNALGQKIG